MDRLPKPPPSRNPLQSTTASNVRAGEAAARSSLYYLLAILSISAIGAVSVLSILYLRPDSDNTQLIVTIFGFLTPTLLFLFSLVRQIENGVKVEETRMQSIETHNEVNSRMSEMKILIENWAYEQGRKEGVTQQKLAEKMGRPAEPPVKPGEDRKFSGTTLTPVAEGQPLTLPATVVIAEAKPED